MMFAIWLRTSRSSSGVLFHPGVERSQVDGFGGHLLDDLFARCGSSIRSSCRTASTPAVG